MATYNVNRETGALIPVSGGTLYADNPVGTILPYGGSVAPTGWFICDGTALNRTSFAELFSVIGTQFGAGNGSTTFNIPDMREMVPRGAGTQSLKTVGAHNAKNVGEFQDDRVQTHNHGVGTYQTYWSLEVPAGKTGDTFLSETGDMTASSAVSLISERRYAASNTDSKYDGLPRGIKVTCKAGNSGSFTGNSGNNSGRTGNTTEVKSVGVNYIIKATRIAVPADFMASVHEAMNDSVVTEVTGSGSTNCSFRAYKKNGIVTVYFIVSGTVASGQDISFGLLPEGYRPKMETWSFIGNGGGGIGNVTSLVYIPPSNGNMLAYTYNSLSNTSHSVIGNVTFIA